MEKPRRKDYSSGFLLGPCDTCSGKNCPLPAVCDKWEVVLECVTHADNEAYPQLWGDPCAMERAAAHKDGTGTGILMKW